ncbi:MAG: hypothetical protein ACYDBJ_06180 [Aggregatilineales bacterium]
MIGIGRRLINAILDWIDERRWRWQFTHSQDALARLASEALADCEAGLTDDMDEWLEEDQKLSGSPSDRSGLGTGH